MTQKPKSISKDKFKTLRLSDFFSTVNDGNKPNQNIPQDALNYIENKFKVVRNYEIKGETYFVVEA